MSRDVVFVITPIGAPGSDVRRRSDDLLELVIEPVIADINEAADRQLRAVRGDKIDRPGSITEGIVEHILGSRAVIVDLAGANPNVYYEMGIADSFGIPTVRLAEDPGSLPFDAKDHNAITLVSAPGGGLLGRDVESCRVALRAQLDHALADGFVPTSIVVRHAKVAQIDALTARLDTGDEQGKALAVVLEKLGALESLFDGGSSSDPVPSDPSPAADRTFDLSFAELYGAPASIVGLLSVLAGSQARGAEPIPRDVWQRAALLTPSLVTATEGLLRRRLAGWRETAAGEVLELTCSPSAVRKAVAEPGLASGRRQAALLSGALREAGYKGRLP